MKRVLTSMAVLLVVFVVFALLAGQLRTEMVGLRIPFLRTIQISVEALAYISFFIGLLLATAIAVAGDMALRKRFRAMMRDQGKLLKAGAGSDEIAGATAATPPGDRKSRG